MADAAMAVGGARPAGVVRLVTTRGDDAQGRLFVGRMAALGVDVGCVMARPGPTGGEYARGLNTVRGLSVTD